ncbi:hypothetical protein DdX_16067 [Ditylenchus destructor]|uniref:Uncharacterized protein n=1 Tax=Ditylenchus destructor TaxID=166010 RepID=A0AAD4QU87_9BILA|nr:hypothetical protein DdX_16067 [Ditylenchus destructor]
MGKTMSVAGLEEKIGKERRTRENHKADSKSPQTSKLTMEVDKIMNDIDAQHAETPCKCDNNKKANPVVPRKDTEIASGSKNKQKEPSASIFVYTSEKKVGATVDNNGNITFVDVTIGLDACK